MIITADKRESWKVRVDAIDYAHNNKNDNFVINKKDIKTFYKIKKIVDQEKDLNKKQNIILSILFLKLIKTKAV